MRRNSSMFPRVLALALFLASTAPASLVRIEVTERSDVLGGKPFGATGPYERIIGKAYFAVDPKLSANRIICDIDLAPRNAQGLVEFSADLYVLRPRDPAKGNGTVLFSVPNRGRKGVLPVFNLAAPTGDLRAEAEFGDGFVFEQGFTLAWLGWQSDVPGDPQRLRLDAPVARDGDRPIIGLVRAELIPDRRGFSFSLGDFDMLPYPVLDPDDPSLQLTVRERADGPRRAISREGWQFAREESGKPVPDRTHVFVHGGLEPGKIYELVYRAQDPVVAGLGPAAVRDFISFLKYGGPNAGTAVLGQQRRLPERAIGYGYSQTGRFLRTFLYDGFNQDEQNRKVFDGIMAHVAGSGRGSFNQRFAQPSRVAYSFGNFFYPSDVFPFTDLQQTDPQTGMTEGLLSRAAKAGVTPKIFYTSSSFEYYARAASLIHTTLDGNEDAPLAPNTRIYLFAGSPHGPSPIPFPPHRDGTVQNLPNPNHSCWSMRALLVAIERWLAEGIEPPASQYPRIGGGTLVPLGEVKFPKIPGVAFPTRMHRAWRLDFGPQFRTAGIITIEPPKVGAPFATLVPQVDADGNETAGIRMPEIQAPLATYAGWNLRDPQRGAPDELSGWGSYIPFPRNRAERQKAGDPRPSIEERYKGRAEYLAKVSAAARQLARGGYLLERDIAKVVGQATKHWDHLMIAP